LTGVRGARWHEGQRTKGFWRSTLKRKGKRIKGLLAEGAWGERAIGGEAVSRRKAGVLLSWRPVEKSPYRRLEFCCGADPKN